jgi:hypothetical protein
VAFVIVVRSSRFLLNAFMGRQGNTADTAPGDVLRLLVLLLILWVMAKYVDKRPFSTYGLKVKHKAFWVDFGFGVGLGALLITAVFTVQYGLGWITIVGMYIKSTEWWFGLALLLPLVNLIAAAIFVELFFRGYLLVNLGESFNFLRILYQPKPLPGSQSRKQMLLNILYARLPALTAWAGATAFFLLYRTADGMATSVLLLNLVRVSFLLALPFLLTRNLGMPIGLNLGWNFFAANIFGLRVPELIETKTSVLSVLIKGPVTLTGGTVGPEAGLIGMGAIVIGGTIVTFWLRYRQKQMPPGFDPWSFAYELYSKGETEN